MQFDQQHIIILVIGLANAIASYLVDRKVQRLTLDLMVCKERIRIVEASYDAIMQQIKSVK